MSKHNKHKKHFWANKEQEHNILDVESLEYLNCDWCKRKDDIRILKVPWSVWATWLQISIDMGNLEWTGVYDVVGDTLCNFRIPKQTVSSTACEILEDLGGNGIVHSHHTMGAFHSGQDDKHARNLYDWSIVISSSGYDASARVRTPCGGWGHKSVVLEILDMPLIDMDKIVQGAMSSTVSGGMEYDKDTEAVLDDDTRQYLEDSNLPYSHWGL